MGSQRVIVPTNQALQPPTDNQRLTQLKPPKTGPITLNAKRSQASLPRPRPLAAPWCADTLPASGSPTVILEGSGPCPANPCPMVGPGSRSGLRGRPVWWRLWMTTGIGHPGDHADGLDSPRVDRPNFGAKLRRSWGSCRWSGLASGWWASVAIMVVAIARFASGLAVLEAVRVDAGKLTVNKAVYRQQRRARVRVRLAALLLRDADRGEGVGEVFSPWFLFGTTEKRPLRLGRSPQHLAQPALGRPAAAPGSPVVALR